MRMLGDHLERDAPVAAPVLCAVHLAHPGLSESASIVQRSNFTPGSSIEAPASPGTYRFIKSLWFATASLDRL